MTEAPRTPDIDSAQTVLHGMQTVDVESAQKRRSREGEIVKGNIARTVSLMREYAPQSFPTITALTLQDGEWRDTEIQAIQVAPKSSKANYSHNANRLFVDISGKVYDCYTIDSTGGKRIPFWSDLREIDNSTYFEHEEPIRKELVSNLKRAISEMREGTLVFS